MIGKLARALLVTSIALCPAPLMAQSTPRFTAELTDGSGGHSDFAGATWYRSDRNIQSRLAVALLTAPRHHLAAFISGEYAGQYGAGDELTDCEIAPNGTCRKYFPGLEGRGVIVGARAYVHDLTLGVGVGRVGGLSWDAVDGDVELGLGRHIGVVAAARRAWRSGPDAQPIAFWPFNLGSRVKL